MTVSMGERQNGLIQMDAIFVQAYAYLADQLRCQDPAPVHLALRAMDKCTRQ